MVTKKKPANKEVLAFTYPCYICGNILVKARQVINHVEAMHGYKLPVRHVGHKRPQDPYYDYNNNPSSDNGYDVCHYACSSCWFHCPEAGLKELSDHVNAEHHPENVDPTKNNNGEIRGGEVTDMDRNTELAKRSKKAIGASVKGDKSERDNEQKNKSVQDEKEDKGQDEDGDQEMTESNNMMEKGKGPARPSVNDIYQKLNELADMFQMLFKGKDDSYQ